MSERKYKTTTGEFVYLRKIYETRSGDLALINQIVHCSNGLVIGGIVNGKQEWWTKDGYRRTDEKETYIDLVSLYTELAPGTHITGKLEAKGGFINANNRRFLVMKASELKPEVKKLCNAVHDLLQAYGTSGRYDCPAPIGSLEALKSAWKAVDPCADHPHYGPTCIEHSPITRATPTPAADDVTRVVVVSDALLEDICAAYRKWEFGHIKVNLRNALLDAFNKHVYLSAMPQRELVDVSDTNVADISESKGDSAYNTDGLVEALTELRDYAAKEILRGGAHHDPIWAKVANLIAQHTKQGE